MANDQVYSKLLENLLHTETIYYLPCWMEYFKHLLIPQIIFYPGLDFSTLSTKIASQTPIWSPSPCTVMVQNAIHTFCGRTSLIWKSRFALHWSSHILLSDLITYLRISFSLQMLVLSFDSQYNSHPKRDVRSQGILMFLPFISITHSFCHLSSAKIERNKIKAFKSLNKKNPQCPHRLSTVPYSISTSKWLYNYLSHLCFWNSSLILQV